LATAEKAVALDQNDAGNRFLAGTSFPAALLGRRGLFAARELILTLFVVLHGP